EYRAHERAVGCVLDAVAVFQSGAGKNEEDRKREDDTARNPSKSTPCQADPHPERAHPGTINRSPCGNGSAGSKPSTGILVAIELLAIASATASGSGPLTRN